VVARPSAPGKTWLLFGVAATSASNAWAVGYSFNPIRTLILHWNGKTWS